MDDTKKKGTETTTSLNVNETFTDDEITLTEEVPEPDEVVILEDEEESVTVRMPERETEQEIQKEVPDKIKEIEQRAAGRDGLDLKERFKAFVNLISLVLIPIGKKIINGFKSFVSDPQNKRILFIGAGGVLALILIIVVISRIVAVFDNKPKVKTIGRSVSSGTTKKILLSKITLKNTQREVIKKQQVKAGSFVYVGFEVKRWDSVAPDTVNLSVDIRVYASNGRLELFKPEFMTLSDSVDPKSHKIVAETKLSFAEDTPPGLYRVVLTVTEDATQKQDRIQTRIKVIS